MAIAFRNKNTNSIVNSPFLSLTKPTGTVEGDLIIISVIGEAGGVLTVSGFAEFATAAAQSTQKTTSFWKQAGASEPSSYTVSSTFTQTILGAVSSFYETTGVGDWTLEFDVGDRVVSETSITTSSITTSNSSLLYINFTNDDDETVISAPTDMTNIISHTASSIAQEIYFELKNSDTLTKSLTWSGSAEELISNVGVWTSSVVPPAGVTRKIKISGTFQDKPIKTKVAGTFVDKPIKIKVGGVFQ